MNQPAPSIYGAEEKCGSCGEWMHFNNETECYELIDYPEDSQCAGADPAYPYHTTAD